MWWRGCSDVAGVVKWTRERGIAEEGRQALFKKPPVEKPRSSRDVATPYLFLCWSLAGLQGSVWFVIHTIHLVNPHRQAPAKRTPKRGCVGSCCSPVASSVLHLLISFHAFLPSFLLPRHAQLTGTRTMAYTKENLAHLTGKLWWSGD